jgi:PAT family beta-lactamase induction signal transducer AmpG
LNNVNDLSPLAAADVSRTPWRWVPTLYFAQGIPYAIVAVVSVITLKRLGLDNARVAFYTSLLGWPWVVKPLWSPLVQTIGTRRSWTVAMQLLAAVGLVVAALSLPAAGWLHYLLAAYAFIAIASATHDIAADGLYLLSLSSHQQAWFVGIRNTAYRLAMIFANGVLVVLAGTLESTTGLPTVPLAVSAVDKEPAAIAFDPAALQPIEIGERPASSAPIQIELSLRGRGAAEAKVLIEQKVRRWNVDHGFYAEPPAPPTPAEKNGYVARFEEWIRQSFGLREAATNANKTGDLALLVMQLAESARIGDQQVVQIGLSAGDSAFKVVEGERFELTPENWDQPFIAVIQVEPSLRRASSARFEIRTGNIPLAWMTTLLVAAGIFFALCAYHYFVLPRPAGDVVVERTKNPVDDFFKPIATFFAKPRILALLAFLLLYRLPEAQLTKLAAPFLVDSRDKGGLSLTTSEYGLVYGTVGVVMLLCGGIVGGIVASKHGLKRWLWPMALAIHLPNAAFLFLAYLQPENRVVITTAVGVEQFGYGFGFTAYMLYCLYIARGEHQTVHYALCTGLMALGMMIPGLWSGWLQRLIGYEHFFVWIMLCTIPSFMTVAFIPLDPDFGKKGPKETA